MLKIVVPAREFYDDKKEEFINVKETRLVLEHSLVSISKWEAFYCKPFMTNDINSKKTNEEILKYIECMTITQNVDPMIYKALSPELVKQITDYISSPMSATTFSEIDNNKGPKRQVVTSELIYYWMTAFNIPFECEKWPIKRLLNLIHICSIKNAPPKKMGRKEILSRNKALNDARRKKLHTHG